MYPIQNAQTDPGLEEQISINFYLFQVFMPFMKPLRCETEYLTLFYGNF